MKKSFVFLSFVMLGLVSCFSSRDYVVESDYSYAGKFKNYKTYAFITQQKFDADTLIPDVLVRDAISYRLSLLGYKEDLKNPNILIGYKIFFSDFNFQGWEQPKLEEWIEKEGIIDEEFDPVKYKLKEGTMIILFVDNKQKKAIWQGYNSGLIDPTTIDNERFLKGTVRTIFDKYRVFAEGYLREG